MLALYFFQGEHGESELTPNACMINTGGKPVVLSQFMSSIAAGEQGPFACRFKVADKQCGYVWKDVTDPTERLPEYDGVIFAKILRLSAINRRPLHTRLRRKLPDGFKQRPYNPPVQEPESTTTRVSSGAGVGIKSSTQQSSAAPKGTPAAASNTPNSGAKPAKAKPKPAAVPASNASAAGQAGASAKKLPKPASAPSVTAQHPPAESFEAFLSGSGGSSSRTPQPKQAETGDFISFADSPAPARQPVSPDFFGVSSSNGGGSTESPGIDIDEYRSAPANGGPTNGVTGGSAMDLYQEVEAMNKKRSDEMEEARLTLGPRLTQWAEDNGKKRNVRTLLTTMHDVLWEGARWKQVSLADVIDPKKVKLVYRKAMLVVHPDRNTNLSGTEMFIAKRVFEAINEAYSEFLEHEQP